MKRLSLHTELRPIVEKVRQRIRDAGKEYEYDAESAEYLAMFHYQYLFGDSELLRFDCKAIDEQFAKDTGHSFIEEFLAGEAEFRIPGQSVLLEVETCGSRLAVVIFENDELPEGWTEGYDVSVIEYSPWYDEWNMNIRAIIGKDSDGPFFENNFETESYQWEQGLTGNPLSHPVPWNLDANTLDFEQITHTADSAITIAIGCLELLSENLVISSTVTEPRAVTFSKKKTRVLPLTADYRILSINVGEAKRRARSTSLKHHESPRLHWRRGHWRTIHRLSEFERKTWVKKCIVGDPDKGFCDKAYRLVNHQTFR